MAEDFRLPSGETVQLRGLTGFEVMLSRKKHGDDPIGLNGFMISCAMGISEDAGMEWMKTHVAGDFVAVTEQIQQLSGLAEGAIKSDL